MINKILKEFNIDKSKEQRESVCNILSAFINNKYIRKSVEINGKKVPVNLCPFGLKLSINGFLLDRSDVRDILDTIEARVNKRELK